MTVGSEAETSGKGNDPVRKDRFSYAVEKRGKGKDRPASPQPDVVAAVRSEHCSAWVEVVDPPRVENNFATPIKCKHPVITAVDVHEPTRLVVTETTRVGYPAILAEWSDQRTVSGETEDGSVPVTVGSVGARNQERGHRTTNSTPNV